MKQVSVILARGGSKGIPNKNIILLKGRPLIYYTINASLMAGLETWVSTDSEQIARISEINGAKVLERPAELATDTATSESALIHFCKQHEAEQVVMIQPTSPLLKSEDLKGGLALAEEYDSVFSGYLEHWVPRWYKLSYQIKELQWDYRFRPRRQDVNKTIVENGAFYISKRKDILDSANRYSGKIGFYEMPFHRSFQIDSHEDLLIIEALLR